MDMPSVSGASRAMRLLLVEIRDRQAPRIAALLAAIEGPAYELETADDAETAFGSLRQERHDAYLIDAALEEPSAVDFARDAVAWGCSAPVLIVGESRNRELESRALAAGAADFLAIDQLTAETLERALRYALDRRQLLEALEHERFLLQTLMENLPDSIYFKDAQSRFLRVSRALGERFGIAEPEQVVGKSDFDFFSEEHARQAWNDEQSLIQGAPPLLGIEEKETWPDGRVTWASTTKMPLRSRHGKLVGTFGISRDVSRRREAEEQLRFAKEAAEAASRAKSEFLANMSHEIRTPLNAVIGMTELLLDTSLTATQRDYLKMVLDSGESLLRVINDILDFSKIEAGKLDLDRQPFHLREGLGDTMKSLAIRAHRKNLEVACDIAPDTPELLVGDLGRLRQIVINLVGNSIKFTEAGEVVLRVERHRQLESGASAEPKAEAVVLHFAVADTGIGIPLDKQQRIFEAFEQADTSTTRRFGGTGLGLAISLRLVRMMGGEIWLESDAGQGSTFHFTAEFHAPRMRPVGMTSAVVVQDARVLAVDDNLTNRRILEQMLANWGVRATTAASVSDALAALREGQDKGDPFHLLLTDLNMPVRDGFDLVAEIRDDSRIKSLPVIMLTSGSRPGDIVRCEQLKIAYHLIKPVKQSELLDAVMGALGAAEAAAKRRDYRMTTAASVGSLNILLAEDSEVNQKLAVGLLERAGHRVVIAGNGREALELYQRSSCDLILMDVQMPELDGWQATKELRELEARAGGRHTPIVAMTAHAMQGDRERCLAAGMDDYISKPIRAKQLEETIQRVVKRFGVREESPPAPANESSPPVGGQSLASGIIDWREALKATAGDEALLRKVLAAFLQEGPQLLAQANKAMNREDRKSLERAAHTLGGTLKMLRAEGGAAASVELQRKAQEAGADEQRETLDRLAAEFEKVRREIVAFVGKDDMLA